MLVVSFVVIFSGHLLIDSSMIYCRFNFYSSSTMLLYVVLELSLALVITVIGFDHVLTDPEA